MCLRAWRLLSGSRRISEASPHLFAPGSTYFARVHDLWLILLSIREELRMWPVLPALALLQGVRKPFVKCCRTVQMLKTGHYSVI